MVITTWDERMTRSHEKNMESHDMIKLEIKIHENLRMRQTPKPNLQVHTHNNIFKWFKRKTSAAVHFDVILLRK